MRRTVFSGLALVFCGLSAGAVHANTFAGSYLAGRYASSQNDHEVAAKQFQRALEFDQTDAQLLNDTVLALVLRGDFDKALEWLAWTEQSENRESLGRVARLLTLSQSFNDGLYPEANRYLQRDAAVMSPVIAGLLQGWSLYGAGDVDAAIAQFDRLNTDPGLAIFGAYHKALLLAATGDDAAARDIFAGTGNGPLHLDAHSIGAHAIVTARAGDPEAAIEIIVGSDPTRSDPGLTAIRDDLEAGKIPPFDLVTNAADGASEVFRSFAQLLVGEENMDAALIYARLSQYLKADQPSLALLVGDMFRRQSQFDLATEEFAKVASNSPYLMMAELSRADALADAGAIDAAIAVLKGLERSAPEDPDVTVTLGNILRFEERFEEAEPVYTRAIAKLPEGASNLWRVYYSRGIARERTDRWDLAEADFRKSLELEPDQPLVLNYLGYSLVEQQRNLNEALEMIKTAVERRPEDGYITDSLGWAYYRLGEFEKAVEPMERAAALVATDAVINDHLGDVYWMVGRKREARFQWRRALSFEPEAAEIPKIRRKLEVGLDRFLEEQVEAEAVTRN